MDAPLYLHSLNNAWSNV